MGRVAKHRHGHCSQHTRRGGASRTQQDPGAAGNVHGPDAGQPQPSWPKSDHMHRMRSLGWIRQETEAATSEYGKNAGHNGSSNHQSAAAREKPLSRNQPRERGGGARHQPSRGASPMYWRAPCGWKYPPVSPPRFASKGHPVRHPPPHPPTSSSSNTTDVGGNLVSVAGAIPAASTTADGRPRRGQRALRVPPARARGDERERNGTHTCV